MNTFVLMMCLHPHVQARAQQELDSVIGTERLPAMADREKLPYVNACVRELLRLYPVAPLGKTQKSTSPFIGLRFSFLSGVAHRASKDDYYAGYIPKGISSAISTYSEIYDPDV